MNLARGLSRVCETGYVKQAAALNRFTADSPMFPDTAAMSDYSYSAPALSRRLTDALATLLCLVLLSGCSGRERAPDYAHDYLEALARFPAVTPDAPEAAIERFVSVFTHMTDDDVGERARSTYADALFFNDTLHQATERDALVAYLQATGEKVDDIEVDILGWTLDDGDVYLRWTMRTRFSVSGRDVDALTIGMTHLRFNEAGEVVIQQDFWDSTEGFYRHLPVVGGLIHWIRGRM